MTPAPTDRTLAVVKFLAGWHLVPAVPEQPFFGCRADALRDAARLVLSAHAQGLEITLLVQEEFGELRPVEAAFLRHCLGQGGARVPPRLAPLRGLPAERTPLAPAFLSASGERGCPLPTT